MHVNHDSEGQLNCNCGSKEIGGLYITDKHNSFQKWGEIPKRLRKEAIKELKKYSNEILMNNGRYNLVMTDIAGGLIYEMMKHAKGWALIKKWRNPNSSNINYMWVNCKAHTKRKS